MGLGSRVCLSRALVCRDMLSLSRLHLKLTHLLGSSEISMDKLQDKQDDKRGKRMGRAEVEVGGERREV